MIIHKNRRSKYQNCNIKIYNLNSIPKITTEVCFNTYKVYLHKIILTINKSSYIDVLLTWAG